ncbi:ATP-dependent RNA helicase HrpA [Thermodesulforhabdus norvegica]|uniref:ATP-dependent helicase HrpA n=1 Tax=Thermodesulforhabdus norvegica TaxID=39841 RepID=A0A1I4TH65_9BACT|nr:ATP-dependent RNA helicase HrpA [Thermodesulforhabdus norvegica]SFM75995.1 ATP-dependent helicase HrpA [Thermodesulforhabdus norvegica]
MLKPHVERIAKWKPEELNYPADLPISSKRQEILAALHSSQVVVVSGATGSGKSTQLPKICLEAGLCRRGFIGCTQPRRIAAVSLAHRVGEELKSLGRGLVGYRIRFRDSLGPQTIIKFMTDGILLAEANNDRLFESYDVIIVDEAHERTLNIDFILGMLKQVIKLRRDLRVIIASATIDPEKFSGFFDNAPVVEIPSRTYPVEVRYRPIPDEDDVTYIDAAVDAVDDLVAEVKGDILVFMPTERDIREAVQRLREKSYHNTEIYPLYARMAAWQQADIFAVTPHRKIIVATNVAETSLTIPNVECVVDTGLARVPQYSPKTGTQALPIVKISRASAEQRKGRCGRTKPGICVRLYDEEDFLQRPEFTPPEIRRSNLAEVILRMLYLGLGSVDEFPFMDPPPKTAIKDGYAVLRELGAVEQNTELTTMGRKMARFPLDPRLSRILIEAGRRGATDEVLTIVSALSIQDPRERPFGEEEIADMVHGLFVHPRSDFVTLLNIWKAYHREAERAPSRNALRAWCRKHFLSYRRIQEWISVRDELRAVLSEQRMLKKSKKTADYKDVHCSIISGFLTKVAMHEGKGKYRTVHGKELYLHPSSGVKGEPKWIVAAEVVETSRTFARIVAEIEPEWIEEVGIHLCRKSYFDVHWHSGKGNVVAFEKVHFGSLPVVERRPVIYGRVNPGEARKVFITEALVDGRIGRSFDFIEYNRRIIEEVRETEEKIRRRGLVVDRDRLYGFYSCRIPENVWSLRAFEKFIRARGGDDFLKLSREDVLREALSEDLERLFPGRIKIGQMEIELVYRFSPGSDEDGVTAIVPVNWLASLPAEPFDWLVPGYLEEKVTFLLKGMPRDVRRRFIPLAETVKKVLADMSWGQGNFWHRLSEAVYRITGMKIAPEEWRSVELPVYLQFRFEIVDGEGRVIASGRDLEELRKTAPISYEDDLWERARKKWEREGIEDFPEDIPEEIMIGEDGTGHKRFAYPGVVEEFGRICIRLFPVRYEAMIANEKGILVLIRRVLHQDLKKLVKCWTPPEDLRGALFFMQKEGPFPGLFVDFLIKDLFELRGPVPFDMNGLRKKLERVRHELALKGMERFQKVCEILRERDLVRRKIERYREKQGKEVPAVSERMACMENELEQLVPPDFLNQYCFDDFDKLLKCLKALNIRVDRAYTSPDKDVEKERTIRPFETKLEELKKRIQSRPDALMLKRFYEELRWLVEALKIQVFAPEVKPWQKVSFRYVEEFLEKCPN